MNKKLLIVTNILLIIFLVILGSYFFYQQKTNNQKMILLFKELKEYQDQEKDQEKEKTQKIKESDYDTSDWLTYRNEKFGYEVKYPQEGYYEFIDIGTETNVVEKREEEAVGSFILDKDLYTSRDLCLEQEREPFDFYYNDITPYNYIDKIILTPWNHGDNRPQIMENKECDYENWWEDADCRTDAYKNGEGKRIIVNGYKALKRYTYVDYLPNVDQEKRGSVRNGAVVSIFRDDIGMAYTIKTGDENYMFTEKKEKEYFDKFLSTFKIIEIKKDQKNVLEYSNKKYQFKIKQPDEWNVEIINNKKDGSGVDGIFLNKNQGSYDNKIEIAILPRGGFGKGYPSFEIRSEVEKFIKNINNRKFYISRWEIESEWFFSVITSKSFPKSWSDKNRIEITYPKELSSEINDILDNFRFLD